MTKTPTKPAQSHLQRPFRLSNRLSPVMTIALTLLLSVTVHAQKAGTTSQLSKRPLGNKSRPIFISAEAKLQGVVVKFIDEAVVRSVMSRGAVQLKSTVGVSIIDAETALLSYLRLGNVRPLVDQPTQMLDEKRAKAEQKIGHPLSDLAGFYAIGVTDPKEAEALVNRLNTLKEVEIAYPMPQSEPAGWFEAATPNYESSQAYLHAAPGGVDADYAHTIPGGDGSGMKYVDVEGGWRTGHEDLLANPPFLQFGGQLDLSWRNHGTAVVGEILSNNNGFGTTGIAPATRWGYSSIASQSTAGALVTAGNNLDTGDVILIELHAPGPHYNFQSRDDQLGYVCMEYFAAEYAAVLQLFADGIVVCEAAGNGAENFDDINIYDQLFDTTWRNSHAIICGAGAPPSGLYGSDRSRLGFSNYGERVNLQGYGRGVVTLGYGDLFGGTEDTYYTAFFSGTSSASPIVTGSVLSLQGAHRNAFASVMDADEIRTALVNTGTPQVGSGHIGPRPDLHAAMDQVLGVSMLADTTFGYVPLTVNFTGQSTKTVNSWDWDFGDGDVSSVQSPSHTYTAPGLFTVGLDIQTTEGPYATTRSQFIAAVADTIDGDSSTGAPGSSVRVDIYARNTIPTRQILIPFSWAGPLGLYFDSLTTTGLRTDYFESKNLIHFDPFGGNATLSLTASTGSSNPDLPSDTGAVVSLYFSIPSDVSSGTNPIAVGPYETYVPQYVTSRATYSPVAVSGVVSVCAKAGDADATGQLSISDVTYLIAYIFQGGPAPSPTSRGDADCNGDINISDATFLIAYIFQGGAAPCECAP